MSKKSVFDGKKAIRGGIPFVFPIFGASNILPQHGFARIARLATEPMSYCYGNPEYNPMN